MQQRNPDAYRTMVDFYDRKFILLKKYKNLSELQASCKDFGTEERSIKADIL